MIKKPNKTIVYIWEDLKRCIFSIWTLLGIISIVILMFLSTGYKELNGNTFSIWEITNVLYSSKMIFSLGITLNKLLEGAASGSMFRIFCILCTAIGYTTMWSDERTSGHIRFSIFQVGTYKYVISKFLSGIIYGGFIASMGYSFFLILLFAKLSIQGIFFDILNVSSNIGITFLQYFCGVFLFGMIQNAFLFFFVTWIKNKYLLISIPFFVEYLCLQFLYSYMKRLVDLIEVDLLNIIANFNPMSVIYFFTQMNKIWINLLWLLAMFIPGVVFCIGMYRRVDKGE